MKVKHLFFSMIAAAFLSSAVAVDKSLEIGSKAPKIETIQGTNVVADANSEQKTKVISFWNPKNPASRIANRNLCRQFGADSTKNVDFISICLDDDEDLMNEVLKIDGIAPQTNFAHSQINPRVFKDYGVENSSKAFMISADGKILNIL